MTSRNHQPVANGEFDIESLHELFSPRSQANASLSLGNGAARPPSRSGMREGQPMNNGNHKATPPDATEVTAEVIRSGSTPACLASSGITRKLPLEGWMLYMNKILEEAESTGDPIEGIMIQQIVLGHHNLQRMYDVAANPHSPEEAECMHSAIPKLLAEVRRLALAIREYQSPVASKIVNVVEQQNLAQNQQIAHLTTKAPADAQVQPSEKKMVDTEMVSKPTRALTHEAPQQFIPKSETSRGRKVESPKTPPTINRNATASAGRRPKKPALASDHRSKDRSR